MAGTTPLVTIGPGVNTPRNDSNGRHSEQCSGILIPHRAGISTSTNCMLSGGPRINNLAEQSNKSLALSHELQRTVGLRQPAECWQCRSIMNRFRQLLNDETMAFALISSTSSCQAKSIMTFSTLSVSTLKILSSYQAAFHWKQRIKATCV